MKFSFLTFWVDYKTGFFDYSYIQYKDEAKYLIYEVTEYNRNLNLYFYIVWTLKNIGFDIFNLKVLNIVFSSLAVVRVYSLVDVVPNKRVFQRWVLIYFLFLFPAGLYYPAFVLRESIILFFISDFFVRLVRLYRNKNFIGINVVAGILTLLRPPFVFLFAVNLFRSRLRVSRAALVLVLALILFFFSDISQLFWSYVNIGIYHNVLGGTASKLKSSEVSAEHIGYFSLVMSNINNSVIPTLTKDITNYLILLHFYIPFIYLLLSKRTYRKKFIQLWPLWSGFVLLVFGGILTFFNIRYFAIVAPFIIFPMALASSGFNPKKP